MGLGCSFTGIMCPYPGPGENTSPPVFTSDVTGQTDAAGYFFGDAVLYTCVDGYEIGYRSSTRIVCGLKGVWSEDPPKCHCK